jgi:hypothetical protein
MARVGAFDGKIGDYLTEMAVIGTLQLVLDDDRATLGVGRDNVSEEVAFFLFGSGIRELQI